MFRSTDGGDSWEPLSTLSPAALVIDPITSSTLYAATYESGVYQSTDSGRTCSAINTGLNELSATALAIDPTTPTTLYVATWGGGVYRSTNGGGSWSAVNTGLPDATKLAIFAFAIDRGSPSTVYAAGGRVFQSIDSGGSWTDLSTGLSFPSVLELAIASTTPTTVYAGTEAGVFSIQQVPACGGRLQHGRTGDHR